MRAGLQNADQQQTNWNTVMKILNQIKLATLASVFTTLLVIASPAAAGEIRGNSGNNFTLTPTATPGVFTLTHPGVAQVSLMGNCTFDGTETVIAPTAAGQPFITTGTFRFTSADGTTTLDVEADGIGTPDPANPNFINVHYTMKFTGGTGKMANVRGKGELNGVAVFTSATGGTTTFVFDGQVSTHGHGNH
jgi:hypothetical protein